MTDQEILTALTRILRDLLLDDLIVLTMETRREDVPTGIRSTTSISSSRSKSSLA